MRILGEILLLALGLAAVLVVGRGLGPVAPALRVLLHPAVLVAGALLFVLLRLGGSRRTNADRRPPHEAGPPWRAARHVDVLIALIAEASLIAKPLRAAS